MRFALCHQNVGSLSVVPSAPGGAPGLAVQLTPEATRELDVLSGGNVGRDLEVTFGEWVFLRAPIQKAIRSGLLVNQGFAAPGEAEAALEDLRAKIPVRPCGAGS